MYDDHRYNTVQQMQFANAADATLGSARSARVEVQRKTMLTNIVVKDWNLEVITGATCTGTGVALESYNFGLAKSAAGTGTLALLGNIYIGGTSAIETYGVKAADGSVIDGSMTASDLTVDAGDDLIFTSEIGTALGDATVQVRANVAFVEQFVAE